MKKASNTSALKGNETCYVTITLHLLPKKISAKYYLPSEWP